MWQRALPVLDSCVGGSNSEEGREGILRELREILTSGESSTDVWKRLTADACAARLADPKSEDQQMSHDAKLVMDCLPPVPCTFCSHSQHTCLVIKSTSIKIKNINHFSFASQCLVPSRRVS